LGFWNRAVEIGSITFTWSKSCPLGKIHLVGGSDDPRYSKRRFGNREGEGSSILRSTVGDSHPQCACGTLKNASKGEVAGRVKRNPSSSINRLELDKSLWNGTSDTNNVEDSRATVGYNVGIGSKVSTLRRIKVDGDGDGSVSRDGRRESDECKSTNSWTRWGLSSGNERTSLALDRVENLTDDKRGVSKIGEDGRLIDSSNIFASNHTIESQNGWADTKESVDTLTGTPEGYWDPVAESSRAAGSDDDIRRQRADLDGFEVGLELESCSGG
jgi:hypothetical protein